jgi:hypothetical protein
MSHSAPEYRHLRYEDPGEQYFQHSTCDHRISDVDHAGRSERHIGQGYEQQ